MSDFFGSYGIFLAETVTTVVAVLVLMLGIFAIARKNKDMKGAAKIKTTKLNQEYEEMKEVLQAEVCDKAELKALQKQQKAEAKAVAQQRKEQARLNKSTSGGDFGGESKKRKIFVLDFEGDIKASAVSDLRQAVTAILTTATPRDEVVVRIESAGGVVHGYGLAASQLSRIRERHIPLTAIVDKIAASGGYMMASVADRILAAPFAIVGSVGVVAQMPNFHRFLKKHDIDFEQVTAGEYKRTLTVFGENTNKGRQKMQEEVNEAHELFKKFVAANRAYIDINAIATGEHWFGTRAKELRLIDEIATSDDYLLKASSVADIFVVSFATKKGLVAKLLQGLHGKLGL